MKFPSIYLASSSPRRSELLTQIGVDFDVLAVDVDERRVGNETPQAYVQRVALAKAIAGWESLNKCDNRPVLGADTSVVLSDVILGKPRDEHDARSMLESLSGRSHQVMTAVALVNQADQCCLINISTVSFTELSEADILWYLSTREGFDKAGGYAIQGLAALFISELQGSYSGVMGLPLRETGMLLMKLGGAQDE